MAVQRPERPPELPTPDTSLHESWLPREHPLYRPRHTSQRVARVCAAIFFVVPVLSLLVLGPPPAIENHAVVSFPGLTKGWGFFSGLAPWAVDNLPFRKDAIDAADGISRHLFGEPAPLGQGVGDVGPLPAQTATPTTTPSSPSGPADQAGDGYPVVVQGTDGWLYFGFDMQARCAPAQPLTTTVANLDRLRDVIQRSGRQFVLVVGPDKSSAQPQHLPATYAGKSCAGPVDQQFWHLMDTDVGIVDVRPDLAAAWRSGQEIYFPQDSHWTFTGGLIMARDLAERIQPGITKTWHVTRGPRLSGAADLPPLIARTGTDSSYSYHLAPNGTQNLDRPVAVDNAAPVVLHTDDPGPGMLTATTTMINDSFAEYASPLLAASFANLTMVSQGLVESDPAAEVNRMVDSQVVVVEIVERNLVAGQTPIATPGFVDSVAAALAAHPAGH